MIGLAEFQISTLLSAESARPLNPRRFFASQSDSSPKQTMLKSVQELFSGVEIEQHHGDGAAAVTCLITDSRRVVPGALFFAIGGLRTDGNYYIEEAVDRGAVAIVTEQNCGSHLPIDCIQVSDVRATLAVVSKAFYESPDEDLAITGITGTNGKTTVSMLLQYLLGGVDTVGLLGTIRYDLGRRSLPSFKTTPESVDVYALLSQMIQNDCSEAVMEISSHGIDQKRVHGLNLDVAVFLNLTQDHIDYHESMDAYYAVKERLFLDATQPHPKAAVVNYDCPYGQRLIAAIGARMPVVSFGMSPNALIRAEAIVLEADQTSFELIWPEGRTRVVSPLLGRYNVSNLLAAFAVVYAKGGSLEPCLLRLPRFPGVPGRMERVDCGQNYNVLIDYAHTDDALKHACGMLREVTSGRLIVVFGCGGDRDRSKRAPMLRAALEGASSVFVTADNPRSESLEQIFADMRKGTAAESLKSVAFVSDRKRAISLALDTAQAGDCVLIAGKGHESYQEFDGTVIPFDDRQVTRELLQLKSFNVKED